MKNFNLKKQHRLLLPLSALAMVGCAQKSSSERPNMIIIMTDDHTTQAMSCYGSDLVQTPNLDRLANEGMLFNNCFVSNAISGPSRACILTGKYSHVNGFTDNSQTFDGDQQTFIKLLKAAHYQTAMVGKWHLMSEPQGFDFWSILIGQGEYYRPKFIENGETIEEEGYVSDVITDKAIGWLEQKDDDKPFAMLYYHKAPHRNWMPAQRDLGIYRDHTFPEPATLLDDYSNRSVAASSQEMAISKDMWPEWDLKIISEEDLNKDYSDPNAGAANANQQDVKRANSWVSSLKQIQNAYNRMTEEEKAKWNATYAPRIAEWQEIKDSESEQEIVRWKYQQYMQDYCATLKSVDDNVGRLLDYLEQTGQADNTIIIYTSDQGFYLGDHGWFDKRFMYDECHRTPLLVRYPNGVKAGTKSDALAMNIDFAPTLLDYAGVKVPKDIQGLSLRKVLTENGEIPCKWRDAVYYHYYEYPSWHSVKRHYGIRTHDYKLIHFYNDIDEWELFDMKRDPNEMVNRYNDQAYKDVQEMMHKKLREIQKECGDTDPTEQEIVFFQGGAINL